jgi:hypothetical protein
MNPLEPAMKKIGSLGCLGCTAADHHQICRFLTFDGFCDLTIGVSLVGGLEHFLFFHLLGIVTPTD